MQLKKVTSFALFLSLAFFFVSSYGATDIQGSVEKNVYTNNFFGFTIKFPKEWNVLSKKQMAGVDKLGEKIVAGQDKNLKQLMDSGITNKLTLFMVAEKPLGLPGNTMVQARVTNLGIFGEGIKSGKVYLDVMKQGLEHMTTVQFEKLDNNMPPINLGGVDFAQMIVIMKVGPSKVTEHFYAAKLKGYILHFLTAYANKAGNKKAENIINSIKFKKSN